MANVLIQGAGIAGGALAAMLSKQGHPVTVVERASSLRQGGQAVDVRGAALMVVERMDLIQDIRACRTSFRGMSVCQGEEMERTTERTLSGGRLGGPDVELFRDDLSRILYDAANPGVTYMFGDQVAALHQEDRHVDVRFEGGGRGSFDLLIGADGLHSGVRRRAFGPDDRYLRPLGIYHGIYSAPNRIGLHNWQLVFRTLKRGVIIYPLGAIRSFVSPCTSRARCSIHRTMTRRRKKHCAMGWGQWEARSRRCWRNWVAPMTSGPPRWRRRLWRAGQ